MRLIMRQNISNEEEDEFVNDPLLDDEEISDEDEEVSEEVE